MKFCAIATVVGYATFAIFAVLAIFANEDAPWALEIDTGLAALGFIGGSLAWLRISRGNC